MVALAENRLGNVARMVSTIQAAGVLTTSPPSFEQQECIDKAKALFRAAEEARRFASAAKRGQ